MTGGLLQEVPTGDWKTFGIVENWSLRKGGRNRRFDCIHVPQEGDYVHFNRQVFRLTFFVLTLYSLFIIYRL